MSSNAGSETILPSYALDTLSRHRRSELSKAVNSDWRGEADDQPAGQLDDSDLGPAGGTVVRSVEPEVERSAPAGQNSSAAELLAA